MRIRFTSEGGFAYIPGMHATVDIDTSRARVSDARELESLVHAADFFQLPARVGALHSGAADQPTYTITIDSHTVVIVEGAASPSLQRLVDRLRRVGRSGTEGGGATHT